MHVPYAGSGLHEFILSYTSQEILRGKSKDDVFERTWALTQDQGRPHHVLKREIDDAVQGAVEWLVEHPGASANGTSNVEHLGNPWEWCDYIGNEGIRRPPPWSKWVAPINRRLISQILHRPMLGKPSSRRKLRLADLYANFNFPLCLAHEVNLPRARTLDYWRGRIHELEATQWMVPNPCLRCGDGGAVKTDENAGERIWLIIEFDQYGPNEQAKLLFWLERAHAEWDLAMIVYSGGKSLHGWFSCVGMLEHKEIVRFFRVASSLGCDKMMRSSVQYTRFPLGINRKTKRLQRIIHWNDEVIALHNENLTCRMESE